MKRYTRYQWRLWLVLCVAVFIGSCRPVVDLPVTDTISGVYYTAVKSYTDLFTAVWQGINVNYVYWDIERDGLWDNAWSTYKPKFDALGAWDPAQYPQALRYFEEMVTPLHDGHFQLMPDDLPEYSPQMVRVDARFGGFTDDANPKSLLSFENNWSGSPYDGYPDYIQWSFVRNFIGPQYLDGAWGGAANRNLSSARGKITTVGGHIAYLYFSGFKLQEVMEFEASEDVSERNITAHMAEFWDYVYSDECRGIIFDLRGNSGGAIRDIPFLLSPLLEKDLHFAYTRSKKGEGRLNYGAWTPWIIKAADAGARIAQVGRIPVVALVNDYSISCGELMPLAIKAMPRGHLIGTQTYGATGPKYGDDNPVAVKDGAFTVVWNGGESLNVREAGFQTRGIQFENYEGVGIEPDQVVPFSWADFTNDGVYDAGGTDAQLEAAIQYVRTNQ
jgi:hypothetical protein